MSIGPGACRGTYSPMLDYRYQTLDIRREKHMIRGTNSLFPVYYLPLTTCYSCSLSFLRKQESITLSTRYQLLTTLLDACFRRPARSPDGCRGKAGRHDMWTGFSPFLLLFVIPAKSIPFTKKPGHRVTILAYCSLVTIPYLLV